MSRRGYYLYLELELEQSEIDGVPENVAGEPPSIAALQSVLDHSTVRDALTEATGCDVFSLVARTTLGRGNR